MASNVDEFIRFPSEELLDLCTKEQLLKVAEHYKIEISDKRLKNSIRLILKANLMESGILDVTTGAASAEDSPSPRYVTITAPSVSPSNLLFEQQKELLLLQQEHDREKLEYDRIKYEKELEFKQDKERADQLKYEKELAADQLKLEFKQDIERAKIKLQQERLELVREGKLSGESLLWEGDPELLRNRSSFGRAPDTFDIVGNLRLLPQFNERDPETFFLLFERVANARSWPDSDRALMLQCVLTGKAQEAYSALSVADSVIYDKVKTAVLQIYELVPEAYRQRFRTLKRDDKQTHVEFVRQLSSQFNRWCSASAVMTFQGLCELIMLEQFKDTVPDRIATYINERKVKTVAEAAVLADEYVLTHKTVFVEPRIRSEWRRSERFGPRSPRYSGSRAEFYSTRVEPDSHGKTDFGQECHYCLGSGHWKNECPVLRSRDKFSTGTFVKSKPTALAAPVPHQFTPDILSQAQGQVKVHIDPDYLPFITEGFVSLLGSKNLVPVKILRDTGASESFVLESLLPFSAETDSGNSVLIRGIGLNTLSVPLHRLMLDCGLVKGEVVVGVRPSLPIEGIDVILGNNLAGERVWPVVSPALVVSNTPVIVGIPDESAQSFPEVFSACAVTRSMIHGDLVTASVNENTTKTSITVFPVIPLPVPRSDLIDAQRTDSTLEKLRDQIVPVEQLGDVAHGYFLQEDVLMRKWMSHGSCFLGEAISQVVVPVKLRELVLTTSHNDVAGHMGVRKTYNRILRHFFWPGLKRDVSEFIKTCHTCQLTGKPNQAIKPVPLFPIPVLSQPFEYLIIDCVGPLPRSKKGSNYLLTVMCQTTRFPAAYPLRSITTKSVLKALTQFFSLFGIPKVIQSDQGSNFTSTLFGQVLQQLHIKHNLSSAYHAQSQGALERFHQTLKSLLRAYCTEMDKDWEEGLPWLLLAAREVSQESTGFSPNDLVFGHRVRGLLSVLQDDWKSPEPPQSLLSYVCDFRRRLYAAGEMAKEKLSSSQERMKGIFDRRTEPRHFSPGDQVLALLPIIGSPFQAKFQGPYTVVRQYTEQNYLVATPERRKAHQLCHINLLKPYYARSTETKQWESKEDGKPVLLADTVTSFGSSHARSVHDEEDVPGPDDCVLQGRLKNSETLDILDNLLNHLPVDERKEMVDLIRKFPELFSDIPTRTNLIEHDIDIGDADPIRQRFYRVSAEKLRCLDAEVRYMLESKIAEPSFSSWASPCILVSKPDGTNRFCTDYRKVNAVTKPDSFPLPRMEDCVDKVGAAKFVSKFDLLKGYWQVPLTSRAREISAFITPSGLYSYSVMSFGLRNAPATFQRLMNRVVAGLAGCAVYLDDVVIYADTWEEHLSRIQALFGRLAAGHLTINLAKCEFAQATVTYLGKVVGQGEVRPVRAKVVAIDAFPPPTTKKELMRFLGMIGYYRGFCRNFSTVVAPLTELLKAKAVYVWSSHCQQAFEDAKKLLTSTPVLAAPRVDLAFTLQVDASHVGAGAVLLQADVSGVERPVSFFSRKFDRCQLNYSVIEKEALALIWALQHFEVYVGSGVVPIVVYTDHNPLTFFRSMMCPNQRIMRWCLFLQSFHLDVRHIRGTDNVIADALSRAPCS
uniref:Gypsy retrotransposon integrase-like protein 1 n=1 Tax=Salmo trutta TaxID=8032 RepID=A0A674E7Q6_SALTR